MLRKSNKKDRKEQGRFPGRPCVPGALALMAGSFLFLAPVHAAVPDTQAFPQGRDSVTIKVEARPDMAANPASVASVNAVDSQQGVSMKVGRPPSQSESTGVTMKVSKPAAQAEPSEVSMKVTMPPAQQGQESITIKVSPKPPAMQPKEEPAPEKEKIAVSPEQPVTPPPVSQVEESPKPVEPVPMPEMKIGAGDVGEEPEAEEEGEEVATIAEDYRYIRGAKLNPFRPLTDKPDKVPPPIVESEPTDEGPSVAMPPIKTPRPNPMPIERYPLNSLDLVAIMRMKKEALALVQIPDGNKGFIIRKGTYIGSEGGVVSDIDLQNNKVVVDVEEEDMFGNITINKRQLSLQKTAGDL